MPQWYARHAYRDAATTAVDRGQVNLLRFGVAGEHRADAGAQLLDRQADVEVEEVLADGLVGAQPPEVLGAPVPDLDLQVAGRRTADAGRAGR